MSAASSIKFLFTGEDKTAGAYASMNKRAKSAMKSLKGVLAAAGVGLSIAGIGYAAKTAIEDMSKLADQAKKSGASATDLQKLSGALQQVGVSSATTENMATALQKMTKETGKIGMDGFKEIMADIAGMSSEQERLTALTQVFGRQMAGEFAMLVRQGTDSFNEGLEGVLAMMPAVSDSAVNAANRVTSAFALASAQVKTGWQQMVGDMIEGIENKFGMSFEEVVASVVEYFIWFGKVTWGVISTFLTNVKLFIGMFRDDWKHALLWIGNFFFASWKAMWQVNWEIVKGVALAIADLFKRVWRKIVYGEDIGWGDYFDDIVQRAKEAAGRVKDTFNDQLDQVQSGVNWASTDFKGLADARDAAINIKRQGIEAKELLATGAAAGEAGIEKAAMKAVRDVQDAGNKFLGAGSVEAYKKIHGKAMAAAGNAQATGTTANKQTAQTSEDLAEIKRFIRDILGEFRGARNDLKAVGVV